MTEKRPANPAGLCQPVGLAHAWLVESNGLGTLYLAGQCGYDANGEVEAPGMSLTDVVQLNFFVCSRGDHASARREFGRV